MYCPTGRNYRINLNNFLVSSIRRARAGLSQDFDGAGIADRQELGLGPWNSNKHIINFLGRFLARNQLGIGHGKWDRVSYIRSRDCLSYETLCESLLQKRPRLKADKGCPGQPLKSGIRGVTSMLNRRIARTVAVR